MTDNNEIIHTITINSIYRNEGNYNSCSFKLSKELHKVKNIVVKDINMLQSQYTINKYNKYFHFKHTDNTYYRVELDKGFYTAEELASAITIKMNVIIGYTINDLLTNNALDKTKCYYWCALTALTKKFVIEFGSLGGGTFTIYMGNGLELPDTTKSYYSCYIVLGHEWSIKTGSSFTAEKIPCLSARTYEFRCDFIKNKQYDCNNYGKIGSKSVLGKVKQSGTDGSLIYYQEPFVVRLETVDSRLEYFNIEVFTDNNIAADLQDNWILELLVICDK